MGALQKRKRERRSAKNTKKTKSAQPSLSMSESEDSNGSSKDDEEYEVEDVLEEDGRGKVLVKWVGYDKATWEPVDHLSKPVYNKFLRRKKLDSVNTKEEYEVEKIVETNDQGQVLVKWVGFEETTWEPISNIPKKLYEQFLTKQLFKTKTTVPKKLNMSAYASDSSKSKVCAICFEGDGVSRACEFCKKPVHHMCSIELANRFGAEESQTICFCSELCILRFSGKEPQPSSAPSQEPSTVANVPRVAPRRSSPKTTRTDNASNETNQEDDLGGRDVAFAPDLEDWMKPRLYSENRSLYMCGKVTRQCKSTKTLPKQYQIRWTNSQFQSNDHVHTLSQEKIMEGISNFEQITRKRLPPESWDVLTKPYDDGKVTSNLWDDFEQVEDLFVRFETDYPLPTELAEVEKMKSMDFQANVFLSAPEDLYKHEDGGINTRLKEEHKALFSHSASSSFFAFLPLSFWRKVVENTNVYAACQKQPAVTLEELMKFLGILFYMSTVDKGEFSNYWGDQVENKMFGEVTVGLDSIMSLRRFKHIRKTLSFREGVSPQELKVDPAARIRPLINMLKLRSPSYIDLGRNVAVDESSVACRSKYGRHMIVYNATKPTGKYHFKIYMCCCSNSWYAINFKLHCSSELEQRLADVAEKATVDKFKMTTKVSSEVRKHVLEVTLPIHNTKRIVNTDNFYTSCQLLEALKIVGLYGRGTIRENSKFGPKCFMLNRSDKIPRGTIRQGVEIKHRIVGASWADGSMVNILSNADDSTITTVTRQVGREKILYKAPTCIREYNQCMQGVDRIDQLRARFSIADGHTFKKWHKKLALAYIDIARCNAYIARKLSGSMTSVRDPHREFMMNLSSELISGEWMNSLGDVGMMLGDPALVNCDGVMTPVAASPRIASPAKTRDECDLRSSKQVFPESRAKRECVICRFEGRWPSEQTVYCYNHKVSLCATVHRALGSSTFLCPDQDATCLDKYHRFYYPAGLFNANGNIRRSCSIFKAKKQADLQARVPSTVNEDSECNYPATTDLEYDGSSIEQHENANNVSFASSVPEQDMSFYGSETSFASRESMGSIDYCGRIVELPVSNPIQDTNANENDSPIVLYNVSL